MRIYNIYTIYTYIKGNMYHTSRYIIVAWYSGEYNQCSTALIFYVYGIQEENKEQNTKNNCTHTWGTHSYTLQCPTMLTC